MTSLPSKVEQYLANYSDFSFLNLKPLKNILSPIKIVRNKGLKKAKNLYVKLYFIWKPPSLNELTPIIFNMELTHLGTEASK